MMPTLVQKLDGKAAVVFHCALSQQRGPSAALSYIRERAAFRAKNSSKDEGVTAEKAEPAKPDGNVDAQKVYVLDQGFVGWQELYGTDERLTEGYRKELWSDGDMG
jgi:Cdc25 family phosphatase